MRFLLSAPLAVLLCSCQGIPIKSWNCGTPAGSFAIPKGWHLQPPPPVSERENIIAPDQKLNGTNPYITIDTYCGRPTDGGPLTPEGRAKSFLGGVHHFKDKEVVYEQIGTASNRQYGEFPVFRFHSDWYGENLVAFVISPTRYAHVELWASTEEVRQANTAAFLEFIEGIRLP